jgi:hypothetical protein
MRATKGASEKSDAAAGDSDLFGKLLFHLQQVCVCVCAAADALAHFFCLNIHTLVLACKFYICTYGIGKRGNVSTLKDSSAGKETGELHCRERERDGYFPYSRDQNFSLRRSAANTALYIYV